MDKVSRLREERVGGTHPRKKKKKMFHVKHGPVACCLWTTLVGCGACLWAGPTLIFYFCLRAGGILPALFLVFVRIKTINLKFILRVWISNLPISAASEVWFLEALRPRGYISVSVYHFPTDQPQQKIFHTCGRTPSIDACDRKWNNLIDYYV